ncbi:8160_t:CDS:1, partial [Scutellospora calospora]
FLHIPHRNPKQHHQQFPQHEDEITVPGPVLTHHMVSPGTLAMDQAIQEQPQTIHQTYDEITSINQACDNDAV